MVKPGVSAGGSPSSGNEFFLHALQKIYVNSLGGAWKDFVWHAKNLQAAQEKKLNTLLTPNVHTAFGRTYGFGTVDSIQSYQTQVPIADYDAFTPWIERIAKGESGVLTAAPVRIFERTGGSTATNKLIPYTDGLLSDFSAATSPWFFNLYQSFPKLYGTRSYWSISPVARSRQKTEGGIPIGFEDDAEYFGALTRWGMRQMQAVPSGVAHLDSVENWRTQTLLALLRCQNLGLLSVWSPSFLVLLMQALEQNFSWYLEQMPARRRQEIEAGLARAGKFVGEALWPRLCFVSCWTQGASALFLPELVRFFPTTPFQGKGLLATEGVVSFPLCGIDGSVLAARSHFFEFIDLAHPQQRPVLAHELKKGGEYSPVLSTSGGLYRYHLKDVVSCRGHFEQLPLLRYEGKLDRVSDMCGEKINARQVEKALELALAQLNFVPHFALLAPALHPNPHYCLYVECNQPDEVLQQLCSLVEKHLNTGHHYSYCRDLGQLSSMRWQRVKKGTQIFQETLLKAGLRAGDIKPTCLDARLVWQEAFSK